MAEDEAGPALAATYARLREALRVGFVPTIFRMLGTYELYLTAATDLVGELLASDAAEEFAVRARQRASRGVTGVPAARIPLGADADAVEALLERYNRANPRNLLAARALLRTGPLDPGGVMDPGIVTAPSAEDPDSILADVFEAHGGFVQPGLWRELADFPAILAQAWRAVLPLAEEPAFQETRAAIGELAAEATAGLNPPDPSDLGFDPGEVRSIEAILSWFHRGIAAMIVEVEYLRRICER